MLPDGLLSRDGDVLPLLFGPGDGVVAGEGLPEAGLAFDPTVPLTLSITDGRSLSVRLGGTALPAAQQPAGRYSGTLMIIVTGLGT